jgi:hypothetical protein
MLAQRNTPQDDDVPQKLKTLWKRQKFYADRHIQPSWVFTKEYKMLVQERKEEWYPGNVKELADNNPHSLLVQDDTSNRAYWQNTNHVIKTNTTIKRKAQKTINWKTEEIEGEN